MSESFAELFEQSLVNKEMRPGTIVTGTVVDIQSDAVIVNAGLKSEGVIPIEQFYNNQGEVEVVVGDAVEVSLDAVEDGFGATRLSREKAKRAQVWKRLELDTAIAGLRGADGADDRVTFYLVGSRRPPEPRPEATPHPSEGA
mgnify:CR=1 FL=1